MPAKQISIEKAKQDKLFYFVATCVVYRPEDGRCLVLKRHEREKVHAGKYGITGGKLEWEDLDIKNPTRMNGDVYDFEDAIEKLLTREIFEETGLEVSLPFKYIHSVAYIRPDGVPVMMTNFGVSYKSGEVKLEEGAFTDYKWVNKEEIKSLSCIEGIADEVAKTIELFS